MRNKTEQSRPGSVLGRPGAAGAGAAFTLVELIVVMLIIGLLMALLVPTIGYTVRLGLSVAAQTRVDKLANAAEGYKMETGYYPGRRDTSLLGTCTGSQMLAACAFNYGYQYINERFVDGENDPPSYPSPKYAGYEKGVSDSDTEDDEDTGDTLYTINGKIHTLSDGFWVAPMAICYYVSWPGQTGPGQFHYSDNSVYIPDTDVARLLDMTVEEVKDMELADKEAACQGPFESWITKTNNIPYNDKTFLLISAGPDREFFSDDDATNWKKTE